MKLPQSLALIITGSASFLIPFALASFRLIDVHPDHLTPKLNDIWAIPSDPFDCSIFSDSNPETGIPSNGVKVRIGAGAGTFPTSNMLYSESEICGLGKLNFYRNKTDGTFQYYLDKGNGSSLGTCTTNTNSNMTCSSTVTLLPDGLNCRGSNTGTCN